MKYRYIFIPIAVMLLALYAVFGRQYDTITSLQAAYATLIVIMGALPGVVALLDKREAGLIPLMPLHGLFYAITFGLPVFSSKTVWRVGGRDAITDALVLTILGLLCLYIGYYAFRGLCGRLKPVRSRNVPLHQQIRTAWLLFVMYLPFQVMPAMKDLPSLGQLAKPLGYLSLGILTLLALNNALSRIQLFMLITAVALMLFIQIVSSFLAPSVFLLLFLGVIYWNKKRRIPWQFVLLSALIVILLNPVKPIFRDYARNPWGPQSFYDRVILLERTTQEYYSGGDIFTKISEDSSTVNRLAHISTFGYVIAMIPDSVPYWMGGSYNTLWTSFIPRVLWPDKPRATIGQDFGHRFALLWEGDEATSFNLPWLLEFYANFGTYGVLAGMFLVGVLFRILVQKFSVPVSAPMEHVLGVSIVFSLFYAESNFSLMVGGILTTYLSFVVLMRLLGDFRVDR